MQKTSTGSTSGEGADGDLGIGIDAPGGKKSVHLKPVSGASETDAHLSFSADSPYFASYVENDMKSMHTFHETLHDISGRTRTFGKCGALMAESTRRLALSCRLRRPFVQKEGEDEKEMEEKAEQREAEVIERRRAVGEEMASLLSVMSEVSLELICSFLVNFSYSL